MKTLGSLLLLLCVIGLALAGDASQPRRRPLLVLITAKWCPACHVLEGRIEAMRARGELKEYLYSTLDYDANKEQCDDYMGDNRNLPQLMVYRPDGVLVGSADDKQLQVFLRAERVSK